jgi:hypothetical protein
MTGNQVGDLFDRATIAARTGAILLSYKSNAIFCSLSNSSRSGPLRIREASQLVLITLPRLAARIPSGVISNSVWSVKPSPARKEKYFRQTSRLQALFSASQATEIVFRMTGIINSYPAFDIPNK